MCASQSAEKPLVSVVIPTCNRADLLRRAIDSVRNQTYKEIEIIVVDDASSDGTPEVVAHISDDRLRYLRHERNRGGAATRNTGIQAATGDYIAFLDDDDEWEPDKTEIQMAALKSYDAVLCMSSIGGERNVKHFTAKRICDAQELRKGMPPVGGTAALMARAKLLKEVLFDEALPNCQDWDILIRLAQRCTIGYLPRRLMRYNAGGHLRISNAAVRASLETKELDKRLRFFEKHRVFFGEKWYNRHVTSALLYGLRHQSNRLKRLLDAAKNYGLPPVFRALSRRIYQMVTGNA